MALEIGEPAPGFTLPGWHDGREQTFSLSDAAGSPLVLAFYPGDDTMTCTKQLCSYSDNLGAFTDLGAAVWGISPQGIDSHRRFAIKHELQMPLLADTERQAIKAYGVNGVLGHVRRSIFVVDAAGRLAWKDVSTVGLTFPSPEVIAAAVSGALNAAS